MSEYPEPRPGDPLTALEKGFLCGVLAFHPVEEPMPGKRMMRRILASIVVKLDLANHGEAALQPPHPIGQEWS